MQDQVGPNAAVRMSTCVSFHGFTDISPKGGDLNSPEVMAEARLSKVDPVFISADSNLNTYIQSLDPDTDVVKVIPSTVIFNPCSAKNVAFALEREAAALLLKLTSGTKLVFELIPGEDGVTRLSETSYTPVSKPAYEWLAISRANLREKKHLQTVSYDPADLETALGRDVTAHDLMLSRNQLGWHLEKKLIEQVATSLAEKYGAKTNYITFIVNNAKNSWVLSHEGIHIYEGMLLLYGETGASPLTIDEWMVRFKQRRPEYFTDGLVDVGSNVFIDLAPSDALDIKVRNNLLTHSVTSYKNNSVSTLASNCTLDQANKIAEGYASAHANVHLSTVKCISESIGGTLEQDDFDTLRWSADKLKPGDCIVLMRKPNKDFVLSSYHTQDPIRVNMTDDAEIKALQALPYEVVAAMRRNAHIAKDGKMLALLDAAKVAVDALDSGIQYPGGLQTPNVI